jgi:hypothetical protein
MEKKKKELGCCGYDELAVKPTHTTPFDPTKPRFPTKPLAQPPARLAMPMRPTMGVSQVSRRGLPW